LSDSGPIALDATYSLGDSLSGVGLYSHELLAGLAAAHPAERFDWCYRTHRYLAARRATVPANVRRRLLAEPVCPRHARLFHGLNQRLPRVKLHRAVATFHDLFVMTGEYSTPEFRHRFTSQARDAAARSDAAIAVSEFTRRQVIELLGMDPAHVHVVHHGIRCLPAAPAGTAREKIVLNVGAVQKRKNIVRLVEAFERLSADWRLVLAGSAGFGAEEALARIDRSPARARIQVTGYVSAAELARWYARASIFAFPSLDEGFGMPLLEAMAAGVAVVTSSRSALPEVAGDAALIVDAEDTDALARALADLSTNRELRVELAQKGRARTHYFSWERAVRETWDVYQTLLG
jgi:glycosyltransferase involved in cell wall biosynthesis